MPAPLAPAAISAIVRMLAKQGIKVTSQQAAKIAATRPDIVKASTMQGMNQSALRMVLSNPHMKAMLTGLGAIPVGTAALYHNMTKENEEPTLEGPITEEELIDTSKYGFPRMTDEEMRKEAIRRRANKGIESLEGYAGGGRVRRRVPDIYFNKYDEGGEVLTHEEKIRRLDEELNRMLNEPIAPLGEPGGYGIPPIDLDEEPDYGLGPEGFGEGETPGFDYFEEFDPDEDYGSNWFDSLPDEEKERIDRQNKPYRDRERMLKEYDGPRQALAHGGAVRGYNMGGAVNNFNPPQPQGIGTLNTDPRMNLGNMQNNNQQQAMNIMQTTANAANLNANNLSKALAGQQRQNLQASSNPSLAPTAPSGTIIPRDKRRMFEDKLLSDRKRGLYAGKTNANRVTMPGTMFG
tara:strand:+ start:215 stop:1432 length:1218 start_codon:yes stop_codon:yes gene_type:complete